MRVLVLAYNFPPLVAIGGQRPYSWFKYFQRFGIKVTVVTRHWEADMNSPTDLLRATKNQSVTVEETNGNKIIRVPHTPGLRDELLLKYGIQRMKLPRKFLSLILSFAEFIMFALDNRKGIFSEAEKYLRKEKPDFIIATGQPFVLFRYASLLSENFQIPWVADYRDGWTNNQGNYQKGFLEKLQLSFFRKMEQKYLKNVSFITTASEDYVKSLQQIFPDKKIELVYNGYDDEVFANAENVSQSKENFTLAYAGTMYAHQKLETFLFGFEKFLKDGNKKNVQLIFYGIESQPENVARIRKIIPTGEIVKTTSRIPYEDVIKKLREAHLLLLLSAKGAGWLNAKVFDYLALRRKILLVENDEGVLEKFIREHYAGEALSTVDEVKNFLEKEYALFEKGFFENNPTKNFDFYSRSSQAKIFTDLIKQHKINTT